MGRISTVKSGMALGGPEVRDPGPWKSNEQTLRKLWSFYQTEEGFWPDFADFAHDNTQEFYRPYSVFTGKCPEDRQVSRCLNETLVKFCVKIQMVGAPDPQHKTSTESPVRNVPDYFGCRGPCPHQYDISNDSMIEMIPEKLPMNVPMFFNGMGPLSPFLYNLGTTIQAILSLPIFYEEYWTCTKRRLTVCQLHSTRSSIMYSTQE